MPKALVRSAVSILLSAGVAQGQIISVGPFTGPHTEGFETQTLFRDTLYECLPGRIFAGTADLCDPVDEAVIVPTFMSLFCQATPRNGTRYALGLISPLQITFDSPVTRFGGYFATVGGTDGGTVEFQNAAGTPLGSAPLTTNQCNWTWNGWQSVTPFSRVKIIGLSPFAEGGYIHIDDLEYSANSASCYANCDGSTSPPILNVLDFVCFQTRFAQGSSSANCDNSTSEPVLNVLDFICFQTAFAQGCP
jgi:hypothetical protein